MVKIRILAAILPVLVMYGCHIDGQQDASDIKGVTIWGDPCIDCSYEVIKLYPYVSYRYEGEKEGDNRHEAGASGGEEMRNIYDKGKEKASEKYPKGRYGFCEHLVDGEPPIGNYEPERGGYYFPSFYLIDKEVEPLCVAVQTCPVKDEVHSVTMTILENCDSNFPRQVPSTNQVTLEGGMQSRGDDGLSLGTSAFSPDKGDSNYDYYRVSSENELKDLYITSGGNSYMYDHRCSEAYEMDTDHSAKVFYGCSESRDRYGSGGNN